MVIDLTKYEGHTEGPWDLEFWGDEAYLYAPEIMTPEAEGTSICRMHELNQTPEQILANGSLMADAPLILAEYKRMVRVVNDLRCDLTMMRLDDNHQPQFEDAVRAATKTLSEVIDVE